MTTQTLAAPIDVAANRPLALDDSGTCFRVLEGSVEVFLVERLDDGRPGTRQHLFGLGAGAVLFGMDTAAGLLEVSILATGTPGTRVVPVDRAALLATPDGVAGVDAWIGGLSWGLAAPIVPRPRIDIMLAAGESPPPGGHRRVSAAHGVVWCACPTGGALFLDMEAQADGVPLPLTRDTWLAVPADGAPSAMTTGDVMRAGMLGAALDAFHGVAVDVLPMGLRLAAVDEVNRLRARAEGDHRAAVGAVGALADVFGRQPGQAAELDADQPVLRAVARLGDAAGFGVDAPAGLGGEHRRLTVADVARASRLRTRDVILDERWWTADSGAFLLERAEDGRPLALWPTGRGYRLFDPVENVERRLTATEAAGLGGRVTVFYAPLPERPLRVGDLLSGTLRRRVGDLGTLIGATVLAGLLMLSVPLATTYILDSVIPDNDLGKLWEVAAALFLVAGMTFALRLVAQLASLRIEGLAGAQVQAAVMDRLLRLPVRFFRAFTTGDLATRVMAVERLEKALTATMVASVLSGAIALVSYGLMLVYSWRLALVAIALTVGLALITVLLGLRRLRHEGRAVAEDAAVVGLSLELAGGITKLRLAAAEDRAFLRWARLYAAASRSRMGAEGAVARLAAVSSGYTAFATAIMLAAAVYWGIADTLSLGLLVAFLAAFNTALGGLASLVDAGMDVAALAPIARHAAPILDTVPEVDTAKADPGVLSGAIELSRLTFAYHADAPPVFRDLSLSVHPGEFVAFVGPSGTGKSTLLRLLLGFEQSESGMVLFDGVDIAGLDIQAVRRQCGVVPQNGRLMPGSVLDNIRGANVDLSEDDAWDAARQTALADDVKAMPMGLHTMVTDGGSAFSGGQVQRLLLARAIAGKPRILLLDEATSALDNRTQAVVTDSLNRIAATRLVVAHRLSTVQRADRIIVLNNGGVAEEGPYEDLMARNGFFAAFAHRQLTV